MIRRPLTRIELKMDDVEEFEAVKKSNKKPSFTGDDSSPGLADLSSTSTAAATSATTIGPSTSKASKESAYSRIGFDPRPKK